MWENLTEEQKGYACGLSTGRGFIDMLNPTPYQINIDDMVTNLDRTYRWKGAIPFTVNQHQYVVMRLVELWGGNWQTQFEALTHDLHEYVTGDLPAPFKDRLWMEMPDGGLIRVADVQERVQKAIRAKLGFKPEDIACVDSDMVRKADLFAREMEYVWWLQEKRLYTLAKLDFSPDGRLVADIFTHFPLAYDDWYYFELRDRFDKKLTPISDVDMEDD